jgi:hypothetical protein
MLSHIMPVFVSSSQAAHLFEEIRAARPLPGLTLGTPLAGSVANRIQETAAADLLGAASVDADLAAAVRAGLLLWADHSEASHAISQGLETPEGSYWHGILHRREPDYANAGYWFRRVGRHPLFAELARAARQVEGAAEDAVAGGSWDPFRFIERCEAAVRGRDAGARAGIERLQRLEMELLLGHCAARAVAAGGP